MATKLKSKAKAPAAKKGLKSKKPAGRTSAEKRAASQGSLKARIKQLQSGKVGNGTGFSGRTGGNG